MRLQRHPNLAERRDTTHPATAGTPCPARAVQAQESRCRPLPSCLLGPRDAGARQLLVRWNQVNKFQSATLKLENRPSWGLPLAFIARTTNEKDSAACFPMSVSSQRSVSSRVPWRSVAVRPLRASECSDLLVSRGRRGLNGVDQTCLDEVFCQGPQRFLHHRSPRSDVVLPGVLGASQSGVTSPQLRTLAGS